VAEQLDSGLVVRFEATGREITGFKEWAIHSGYLTSADDFTFTFFDPDPEQSQRLELQPVELVLDGQSQAFGRIDATEVGDDGGAVTCEGRDYIADIVECNVDPLVKVAPDTTIETALLDCLAPCGITVIVDNVDISMASVRSGTRVKHGTRKRKKVKPLQDYAPKPGEGIYEYINRIVCRAGATLQPADRREAVYITEPDFKSDPVGTLQRSTDPTLSAGNNIVRATARRDYSKFPTFTLFTGTMVPAPEESGGGISQTFDMQTFADGFNAELGQILTSSAIVSGRVKPNTIPNAAPGALYRLLYYRDQESRTAEELFVAAKRAIAERLKDTLIYRATVKGHRDPVTGALWSVDTMVNVNDSVARVNEPLWVASRTFQFSRGSGSTTELELWRPESFQIGEG